MKAAMILMTIMGCDDTATDCHHVQTVDQAFVSLEACNAETDRRLDQLAVQDYPMLLAVCEAKALPEAAGAPAGPETAAPDMVEIDAGMPGVPPRPARDVPGMQNTEASADSQPVSSGVLASVRDSLKPGALAQTAMKPVHLVTGSFAWVVRKIRP